MNLEKTVLCAIFGCGTRTVHDGGIYIARIPSVMTNQGEEIRNLSEERRNQWISAISQKDLTDSILHHGRVCSRHFVSGKAAELCDRYDPDWISPKISVKKNVIPSKASRRSELPRNETREQEIER